MADAEQAFVSTRPTLHINGSQRDELQEALLNLQVNQPLNGMSHAEIKLGNWAMQSDLPNSDFAFLDIKLGETLDIYIGEETPEKIFSGEITAIEERYGEGSPQVVLLVQDRLHHLARIRKSRSFDDMSVQDVVNEIASEVSLRTDLSVNPISGTYHQINESNLAFLFRLLQPFDIALRLDEGVLRVRQEEPDREPFQLDAQDNANSVRLLVDLNHQPISTSVKGFNPANDNEVSGRSDSLSQAPAYKTASDHLKALGWKGDDHYPQPFAQTQAAADAYASGHFNRLAKQFVHGEILCRGEATLKSGREIELVGVAERLQGTYQIVNCIHSFNGTDGYETRLKVNRADWNV